jgi:hypothetical protein
MLKLKASLFLDRSRRAAAGLIITVLLLGTTALYPRPAVFAQERGESIPHLREVISDMEAVAKNDATPAEVKEVNENFLRARRAQLRDTLRRKLAGLQNYVSTFKASLNAEELQSVENSVRQLEGELRQLEGRVGGTTTKAADGPRAAVAPQAPSAPVQSDCYPDAPPSVVTAATEAADIIIRENDPSGVSENFADMFFSAIGHAVSVDARNVEREHKDLINRIETARLTEQIKRTDKQIGASARSEGTTSAAEKPGFAELLGFAIEHGAVQKEVSGTSLTLSTSPYSLVAAGSGDTATTYARYGYLSRLGLSANFNISDQNDVLGSATRNQLSEWSARVRLTPDRTQRSRDAEAIWRGISDRFSQPDRIETGELARLFQSDLSIAAKRREIADRFPAPTFSEPIRGVLNNRDLTPEVKRERIAKAILCQMKSDIFDQVRSGTLKIDEASRERIVNVTLPNFAAALQAKNAAIKEFEDGLERLRYKPVLTFAYTNKRDPTSSDYSNLKLLFEKKNAEGWNFVANAGFSLYHKPDRAKNQQQLRDFAAAFSFEGEAGRSPFVAAEFDQKITFALTGRYQRMFENRGVANKKADIALAQFKLNIPIFTGASLPFSFTYANATELVKEDHVRANFGFTLDTDKLFQLLQLNKLKKQ